MPGYELFHQRKLPHYQPNGGSLFVTIRSADPIPEHLMAEYQAYLDKLRLTEEDRPDDAELKHQNSKRSFACMDDIFTRYDGKINFTRDPGVATILSDTAQDLRVELCRMYAYTIMPNHMHLLLRPLNRGEMVVSVSEIMQRMKGASSRKVNLYLKREGSLWYREYYDHWVRGSREFLNIVEYIRQNPVKAGLVKKAEDWKWTWVDVSFDDGVWV
jgi:REP element-mobilizing transposase RayT